MPSWVTHLPSGWAGTGGRCRTHGCQAASPGLYLLVKWPDEPTSPGPSQSEATAQEAVSLLSAHSSASVFSCHTLVPLMSTGCDLQRGSLSTLRRLRLH